MERIALNYIYLSPKHAGGKDQVGLNLLRGFYETGIYKRMVVICYDYSKNIVENIANNIKIYTIKSHSYKGELGRLFWLEYDNTITIPQIVKKEKLNLVFHLSINNGWFKFPCKTVLLPHDIKAISSRNLFGIKMPLWKYLMYKLLYYKDFFHANTIIAISDYDQEEIKKFFSQFAYKVTRIYNPILLKNYSLQNQKISEPYIMALNIQFLHKNIITLIKAYEKIQTKIPHKLVLIGSIPKRVNFLIEYVKKHNLENKVLFTGFVTDEEKYIWLSNADLYVNPTLFEGFGMTNVEALLLGTPCLLSNIPINVEITKGQAAYYSPPNDENALADAIIKALNHPLPSDIQKEKIQEIENEYNYLHIADEYMKCFTEV